MKEEKLLVLFTFLITILGCKPNDYRNINEFYYPFEQLETGKVYVYKGLNEYTPEYDYWFFKSFKQDDTWYLTAQHYDANYNVDLFQLQEMLQSGAYSDTYTIVEIDSFGNQNKVQADVEFGNVYPFKVKDSLGVFLFKISWEDPVKKGKKTTLIRNRRYVHDTVFTYGNENKEGLIFHVNEVAEFDDEGILEMEMSGQELYVKGIGLAYLRKQINDQITLEYRLDTIVEMDYFLREISTVNKWQEN